MRAGIELRAVSQRARPGVMALRDITLTVERGELVAIIGGSEAEKASLLATMGGLRPPASGEVERADGGRAGYVPHGDVIHAALPLGRALRYTAALRHVDDPARAVADVLATLELAGRSAVPVGSLSGEERKRAAIAAELLGGPGLLCLDEPTAGLDPARGAELMRALRRLCDSGTTVVLTTLSPLDAEACDKVAVLAAGGHLAFFGTPGAARGYFGTDSTVEIYERLAGVGDPARNWSRRFFETHFSRTSPASSPAPPAHRAGRAAQPVAHAEPTAFPAPGDGPRGRRPVRQWALLTQRNADLLARSRLAMAMLAGPPLAVLLLVLVLVRPGAFDPARPSPPATVMIMFWMAFGGFFVGLAYGLLAICAEWAVLRRERFAGLSAGGYVLSKVSVLLPLLAVVDLVLLGALRLLGRLPASADYLAVFVTLLLCSASALGLGLLISAAAPEPSRAMLALPVACFPQVLFAGAILPVPVMAVLGQWVSYAMTGRWAFEGLGHSLGVTRLWASSASPLGPPLLAAYGSTFTRPVAVDWLVLAGLTLAVLPATVAVVIRRTL